MFNDIVYGAFAQLSYCHWNKLKDDYQNYMDISSSLVSDIINDSYTWDKIKTDDSEDRPEIYKEEDKRLFLTYSEDNKDGKPKYISEFKGWGFLYFADHRKIYKEYLGIESHYSSGMQATAFKKGNVIVIAYRGTEPSEVGDLLTDGEIGFFNRNSPHLTAAVLFYEYILREYGDGSTIHITGHSLGGALAQYVACYAEGKHKTVTWNALGIGVHKHSFKKGVSGKITDIMQAIEVNKMKSSEEIQQKYLSLEGEVDPSLKLDNMENIVTDIANIIIKNTHEYFRNREKTEIESVNIGKSWKGSFYIGNSQETTSFYSLNEKEIENIETSAEFSAYEIYWLLRTTQRFAISYPNLEGKDIIKNYFNTKDWTTMLQTKLGACINVLQEGFNYIQEEDDTKIRVILQTIDKFGFGYHGVNDFLLYMDDTGNIQPGELNQTFIKNSAKQYFTKAREAGKFKDILSGQDLQKKNGLEEKGYLKNVFRVLESTRISSEKQNYSKLDKEWRYPEVVKNSLKNGGYPGFIKESGDNGVLTYTIGQFINIEELTGIKGGETIVLFEELEETNTIKVSETLNKPKEYSSINESKHKWRGFKGQGKIKDFYV